MIDFTVFIARQHAMHTERDIVLPIPSVRLSVRPMWVLCVNERTYRHTLSGSGTGIILLPSAPLPLHNSTGNPLNGGVQYSGVDKFATFAVYRGNSTRQSHGYCG